MGKSKHADLFDRADRAIARAAVIQKQVRNDIEAAYSVVGDASRRCRAPAEVYWERPRPAVSSGSKAYTRTDLDRANAMVIEASRRLMSQKSSDGESGRERKTAARARMLVLRLEASFVILAARRDRIADSLFERCESGGPGSSVLASDRL